MIIPGRFRAAKVVNGNIEAALKFWKRQMKESDVLQELKDRKEFREARSRSFEATKCHV